MARKIKFHELVTKVQTGKINSDDLQDYFVVQPHPTRPFDFVIGLNPRNVDVSNMERAALHASPILHDASVGLDQQPTRPVKTKRTRTMVAEGDSWFRLPKIDPIVPPTLIDRLQDKYAIINLAHWGDTFRDIILAGEFWSYITPGADGKYGADVLLFSAGGNDILGGGEFWRMINLFDVDHQAPGQAGYYLTAEFHANLELVIGFYDSLIQQIMNRAPKVVILGHGYDYAVPVRGGNWLYAPFVRQGFDPDIRDPKLCAAIVRLIIDAFNNKLAVLEQRYPANFKYVDLRGTLKSGDWWDELHPTGAGSRKTAAKFAAAINALPAADDVTPPVVAVHPRLPEAA